MESPGLEKSSTSPTFPQHQPPTHVPKCHICMSLKNPHLLFQHTSMAQQQLLAPWSTVQLIFTLFLLPVQGHGSDMTLGSMLTGASPGIARLGGTEDQPKFAQGPANLFISSVSSNRTLLGFAASLLCPSPLCRELRGAGSEQPWGHTTLFSRQQAVPKAIPGTVGSPGRVTGTPALFISRGN